jgi:2-hydroxy-3-oxopropionate reductase
VAEAKALKIDLPFSLSAHDRYTRLVKSLAGSELDHSALFVELLDINGRKT